MGVAWLVIHIPVTTLIGGNENQPRARSRAALLWRISSPTPSRWWSIFRLVGQRTGHQSSPRCRNDQCKRKANTPLKETRIKSGRYLLSTMTDAFIAPPRLLSGHCLLSPVLRTSFSIPHQQVFWSSTSNAIFRHGFAHVR